MNKLTIKPFLFFFFCTIIPLHATKGQNKSIDSYLESIRSLIEVKDHYKEEFLDVEYLLAKKEHTEGNEKILVLLKLFTAYIYKSDDAANTYNEQALELSEKIGFTQGILSAKYNKAYHLFVKGHFDASMKMAQEIENLIVAGTFPNVYGDITTLKSDIYTERGEYDKALEVGLKLLDHAEKTKSDYLLMKANAALSHYYLRIEQFSKSLHYCLQGLHYILKLKKTEYIYPKIDEIAKMTAQLNDPQGALEVYSFFLDIEKKLPPAGSYILASVHSNIANIYMSIGEDEKALAHISTALKINYKNNYRFRIPRPSPSKPNFIYNSMIPPRLF